MIKKLTEDDFDDIVTYLDNVSPVDLLDANLNSYPPEYLDTINQIYSEINLPRGVLNCMIIKVLKSKGGVLPKVNYFKSVAETWIGDNILSTQDAIEYTTTMKSDKDSDKKDKDDNGGFRWL